MIFSIPKIFVAGTAALAGLANLAAAANNFRGTTAAPDHMRTEMMRAAMLDELMVALGHGNRVTRQRLNDIEDTLRPMFRSLPKNEFGNLDHKTARYTLHRLFVTRHGMFVKGLEPGGKGWTGASPTEILDDLVPSYVQSLFEERMDGHGLGMQDISVLAATLEHLVHDEATWRLKLAYRASEWDLDEKIPADKVLHIVDTYMALFIVGGVNETTPTDLIQRRLSNINMVYPTWPETQKFIREVASIMQASLSGDPNFANGMITFNGTSRVVEEIVERYGRWQNKECMDLKGALLKLEDGETGRVLLKDFYGKAKGGTWQFTESLQYLKELGAIDDTVEKRKSVIIPNYINAHSNCLASSSIFSICCLNECEPLLSALEKDFGAPEAEPEQVLELVSKMSSSSIKAPRTFAPELRQLLMEVASHHGGMVPLHGRLFGQWMHHAFPRECPYPHKAGTTKPETLGDKRTTPGMTHLATHAEMDLHIEGEDDIDCIGDSSACGNATTVLEKKPLMWSAEEELITTRSPSRQRSAFGRGIAMLASIGALSVLLWNSLQPLLTAYGRAKGSVLPFAGKSHYC